MVGVFPSTNGHFKIIARRGDQVAHADNLTAEQVEAFDPNAFWANGIVRPAPKQSQVSA